MVIILLHRVPLGNCSNMLFLSCAAFHFGANVGCASYGFNADLTFE